MINKEEIFDIDYQYYLKCIKENLNNISYGDLDSNQNPRSFEHFYRYKGQKIDEEFQDKWYNNSSKIPQGKYNLDIIKDNGKKSNIIIMEECGTDNRLVPIFDKHKEDLNLMDTIEMCKITGQNLILGKPRRKLRNNMTDSILITAENDEPKKTEGEILIEQLQELGKKQFANEAIAKEQALKKKHHLHKINQKALQKKSKKKRK